MKYFEAKFDKFEALPSTSEDVWGALLPEVFRRLVPIDPHLEADAAPRCALSIKERSNGCILLREHLPIKKCFHSGIA